MDIDRLKKLSGVNENITPGMRMVVITHEYMIDVKADSAKEAESKAHSMLVRGEIDLTDPTSYSVIDRGPGIWDD